MVDLFNQYLKIKEETDAAIRNVIDNTSFIRGPEVHSFQKELEEYLGVKHVITCGNGTDALQLSLMALDLKPGDEVITPDFTFISTAEVIALLGLTPVFADVDPHTFTIDIKSVKDRITSRTKAIIPVHLYGQCCNMDQLMGLAVEHGLYIIEDSAQALGAKYTGRNKTISHAGTIGHIGCTSFFPSKSLGCFGDGGAIFTNDDKLAEKLFLLSNHGMKLKYHNEIIGVNSRLDTIQAAVLRVKLKHLDMYVERRQNAAAHYDKALGSLPGIKIPERNDYSTHIFHQYTIRLEDYNREEMRKHLNNKGIPSLVYYPLPLHVQEAMNYLAYKEGDFPVTEELCKKVLSLPMHTELDEEQLTYITDTIAEFTGK